MDRRAFLASGAALAGSVARGAAHNAHATPIGPRRVDLVLKGAFVYDGTGAAPAEVDVAVQDDRIVGVEPRITAPGAREIDLRGLALAPGFIDIHSHTDLVLLVNPRAESKVRQGVTTEIVGQDGSSVGPWSQERFVEMRDSYLSRYDVEIDFQDLAGFFSRLEREPPAINLASMIGAGTVREHVMGTEDRPPSEEELASMIALVGASLEDGACGLSSGLEYVPGAFSTLDELTALAMPLRDRALPYASHMRNEDDQLFAAVEEALNVARGAGVPLQVSHLKAQGQRNWWKAEPVLRMLERARADGIDVTFDRYPYIAYSTGLSSLFPAWSRQGGAGAFIARLGDSAPAENIERAVREKVRKLGSWDAVQITSAAADDMQWAVGRRLGELADEVGEDPYGLVVRVIVESRSRAGMIGFGMSEENTARFLRHPLGMVCSDGGARAPYGRLATGTPHPRSYGTFPRVLGTYCRAEQLMPFETAIHKMTAMPAARVRLSGRGRIVQGAFADLVAFDADTVADRATFENPHQYPTGIAHVLVNGRFVIRDGEHTGARPGRVLRPAR